MVRSDSKEASMRTGQLLCFNSRILGEDLVPVKCIEAPGGLDCRLFYGGGSGVVDLFIIVVPIVCGGSVFGPCFVQCFVSF